MELDDVHVAVLLLSSCCSFGKFVHLIRTVPKQLIQNGLGAFDNAVLKCLSGLLCCELPPSAKLQAQLTKARGGLGLRSLTRHASAAFFSSANKALDDALSSDFFREAAHTLLRDFRPDLSAQQLSKEKSFANQFQISALYEEIDQASLISSFSKSDPDLARLNSLSVPNTSTWLELPPCPGLRQHLSNPQARAVFKFRLGIPLFSASVTCDKCKSQPLDPHGHHALTCKCMGSRHNRVVDVIYDFLCVGQFRPTKERGAEGSHDRTRPADILVPGLASDGSNSLAIDVTVVSALSSSALAAAANTHDGSGAVVLAELKKHNENDPKCKELGWECLPFAMDTHGRFGDESESFLQSLAWRVAAQQDTSNIMALRAIRGKIGISLMRANADAILSSPPAMMIQGVALGPGDLSRMVSTEHISSSAATNRSLQRSSQEPSLSKFLPTSSSSFSLSSSSSHSSSSLISLPSLSSLESFAAN